MYLYLEWLFLVFLFFMLENICFIDSESILLMFQRRRYFVKIKRNFGYCVVLMIKKGTYNTDKFRRKKMRMDKRVIYGWWKSLKIDKTCKTHIL